MNLSQPWHPLGQCNLKSTHSARHDCEYGPQMCEPGAETSGFALIFCSTAPANVYVKHKDSLSLFCDYESLGNLYPVGTCILGHEHICSVFWGYAHSHFAQQETMTYSFLGEACVLPTVRT